MPKSLNELLNGADMEGGESFGDCIYNNIKNHWRLAGVCESGGLADPQPGMIVSDETDDRLYHVILASGCACSEILQDCIPLSDDKALAFGDDWNAQVGYDELTNDALIVGIPVSPERGVIVCDIADVGVDFTGLITAHTQPVFWFIDLDNDSYLGVGHQADDRPGIWSGAADTSILAIQYDANADVTFFENSGAGENRNIFVYGYITAGAAPRHAMLRMDDTWDEFVIEAENNASHEGVTVSLLETNQRFRIRQNSDIASMYLTPTDFYIRWSDGHLIFMTNEGVNTATVLDVKGKGMGLGYVRLYEQDKTEYLELYSSTNKGVIRTQGVSPGALLFQHTVAQDIQCWLNIVSGNPDFEIYGYITAGAAVRYGQLRMDDTNDEFEIQAEDNANHEGITVYIPEGSQKFRVRGASRAERFSIDEDGLVDWARLGDLYQWTYQGDLADDATFNLPAFTDACWGFIQAGNNEEYALFTVDDDGDVTLISNSANVVANADVDTRICIGTAGSQEPLQIKNRLGATKNINLIIWYS